MNEQAEVTQNQSTLQGVFERMKGDASVFTETAGVVLGRDIPMVNLELLDNILAQLEQNLGPEVLELTLNEQEQIFLSDLVLEYAGHRASPSSQGFGQQSLLPMWNAIGDYLETLLTIPRDANAYEATSKSALDLGQVLNARIGLTRLFEDVARESGEGGKESFYHAQILLLQKFGALLPDHVKGVDRERFFPLLDEMERTGVMSDRVGWNSSLEFVSAGFSVNNFALAGAVNEAYRIADSALVRKKRYS